MSGKYDSSDIPLDRLMQGYIGPRQEYQPLYERDSHNYGYTDVGQMNSSE